MKLLQAENIPENLLGMPSIVILSKELSTGFIKADDYLLTDILCSKLGAYKFICFNFREVFKQVLLFHCIAFIRAVLGCT